MAACAHPDSLVGKGQEAFSLYWCASEAGAHFRPIIGFSSVSQSVCVRSCTTLLSIFASNHSAFYHATLLCCLVQLQFRLPAIYPACRTELRNLCCVSLLGLLSIPVGRDGFFVRAVIDTAARHLALVGEAETIVHHKGSVAASALDLIVFITTLLFKFARICNRKFIDGGHQVTNWLNFVQFGLILVVFRRAAVMSFGPFIVN